MDRRGVTGIDIMQKSADPTVALHSKYLSYCFLEFPGFFFVKARYGAEYHLLQMIIEPRSPCSLRFQTVG
jgi:hypothetical protein